MRFEIQQLVKKIVITSHNKRVDYLVDGVADASKLLKSYENIEKTLKVSKSLEKKVIENL